MDVRIADYEDYLNEVINSEDPEQDSSYFEACADAEEDRQAQNYESESYYLATGDK